MAAPAAPEVYQRGPHKSGALAVHPQRKQVIEALIDGKSIRSILKWLTPPASLETVARLRRQVIKELDAAKVLHKAQELQALASGAIVPQDETKRLTSLAVVGAEHLSRLAEHRERLDRTLDGAESEGQLETIATLIKTDLQRVRLAAELDGTLAQVAAQFAAPAVQNNLQVVILPGSMPTETLEAPAIEATSTHSPEAD